jgi:hypothetical protein
MKKVILITELLLLFIFLCLVSKGQSVVKNTPGKYMMPMDNASASLPGKTKEGELWIVFSDRPNNPLYSDKSCASPNGQKMDFMKAMYVIEETEATIRVININDADTRGNLIEGATSRAGWVKKENMLLWKTCLKTRDVNLPEFKGGIFNKKAMVLNILTDNQKVGRIPEFYSHPRCNPSDSINSALVYQINYVYKETPTAYLLADIPEISDINNDCQRVRGWVLKSQTTAWNHRLAYEVNWDDKAVAERKASQKRAKIWADKSLTGNVLFQEDPGFYRARAIGEVDRYPVLDVYDGIAKVGVIGDLHSESGAVLSNSEFAKVKHVIDSMSGALRNVNVIFVIDATSSMIPYSKTIQDAIKSSMRDLLKGQNNYRFGALLYRDASEGNSNAIHYTRDLSSNYNSVISYIGGHMTPTYNKCNNDAEECVFYGMKKAVERFDPSPDESNFLILIGDAGNHSRTKYKDCSGQEFDDFTNVSQQELVELMARKNINLFAVQVNHEIITDVKPAYEKFRSQVKDVMRDVAILRIPDGNTISKESVIKEIGKDVIEIDPDLGIPGYFKMAPDGGNLAPVVLGKEIENELKTIDKKINDHLESISFYLNGKPQDTNAKQLKSFIAKLEKNNISSDKLNIIFQKNGQQYNTGYAQRYEPGSKNPTFQSVLLMSQQDLYLIKKSLERLIPTDELSLSRNESRSFIVYGWQEILVDILGYFPVINEAVDTLSLYTLSAILTGWGGKEKFKDIRLMDVTDPTIFSDEMLYEYLIDWCITKGHIQSIYDGQNLLTGDFFEDHMWTYFYEYLFILTNGTVQQDDSMKQKFIDYFKNYNKEYNNYKASFRIPMGTGTGLKHYWIDSRIFPHNSKGLGETDFIETLYAPYLK